MTVCRREGHPGALPSEYSQFCQAFQYFCGLFFFFFFNENYSKNLKFTALSYKICYELYCYQFVF